MHTSSEIYPDNPRPAILVVGSAIEVVYRYTLELIKNPPSPEFPESGNGVSWSRDVEHKVIPFMPAAADRNPTRVYHYLVLLHWAGLLELHDGDGMISLPNGARA